MKVYYNTELEFPIHECVHEDPWDDGVYDSFNYWNIFFKVKDDVLMQVEARPYYLWHNGNIVCRWVDRDGVTYRVSDSDPNVNYKKVYMWEALNQKEDKKED